jgi:hypothetical protein
LAGSEIALVEQAEIHDAVNAVRLIVEATQRVAQIAIGVPPAVFGTPD